MDSTYKHKSILTSGGNLLVQFFKNEKTYFFFMSPDGEYLNPAISNVWGTALREWNSKPEKLKADLVPHAEKICNFITGCVNTQKTPSKNLWDAREKLAVFRNVNQSGLEKLGIKEKFA